MQSALPFSKAPLSTHSPKAASTWPTSQCHFLPTSRVSKKRRNRAEGRAEERLAKSGTRATENVQQTGADHSREEQSNAEKRGEQRRHSANTKQSRANKYDIDYARALKINMLRISPSTDFIIYFCLKAKWGHGVNRSRGALLFLSFPGRRNPCWEMHLRLRIGRQSRDSIHTDQVGITGWLTPLPVGCTAHGPPKSGDFVFLSS